MISPVLALLTAILVAGCQQPRDVATTPPATLDELPTMHALERTLPIRVGVEGAEIAPRRLLVPPLKEPELTPEERVAIGADRPDPGDELLAFYRPPPDPARGVYTELAGPTAGIAGMGGGSVGADIARRPFGVGFISPLPGASLPFDRSAAAFYAELGRTVGLDVRSWVDTGEDIPRRAASRHTSVDD